MCPRTFQVTIRKVEGGLFVGGWGEEGISGGGVSSGDDAFSSIVVVPHMQHVIISLLMFIIEVC